MRKTLTPVEVAIIKAKMLQSHLNNTTASAAALDTQLREAKALAQVTEERLKVVRAEVAKIEASLAEALLLVQSLKAELSEDQP